MTNSKSGDNYGFMTAKTFVYVARKQSI